MSHHHHKHTEPTSGGRLLITLILNLIITIAEIIGGIISGSLALISDAHDIHFEAHIDVQDQMVSETNTLLYEIEATLARTFQISHVTIQFECDSCQVKDLLHK